MSGFEETQCETLPVTVIGGYLGAGKTTLVNHLLRHAGGLRLAVLVNEFGELPIDADLIESQDENVIALAGGCVCCSYGNDLILAMLELAQMEPRPERVLLEASGVALPGAIAASVGLLQPYRLDGVIVLADAETVQARSNDKYMGDTIDRQFQDADLIVVNKVDLVSDRERGNLDEWFAHRFPHAKRIPARQAVLPLDVVFDTFATTAHRTHYPTFGHDSRFETISLAVADCVDPHVLANGLVAEELGLIRAKGFIRSKSGEVWEIQLVGQRVNVVPARGSPASRLVCIGVASQMNSELIKRALARSTG